MENLQLKVGRPESEIGRPEKEIRCYNLLQNLGIDFARVDHAAAETMEMCQSIETVLGAKICKNLFLCNRQETDFYLLMLPDIPFKTKYLSAELNISRLSFASSEYMQKFLDVTPGSVSVLGLMNDEELKVRLIIEKSLLNDEFIGCHPCINTSSLKIKTDDIINKIIPATNHTVTYVDLASKIENEQ